ncbi:MAG: hypothetical protein KDD10_02050 [Phaeodactylibacter sp.]|nr:hypothetical protein [Phaeodactylibacter sp.]MCB9293036.1 hypothetical protein [Lewinellaceae bacterium]
MILSAFMATALYLQVGDFLVCRFWFPAKVEPLGENQNRHTPGVDHLAAWIGPMALAGRFCGFVCLACHAGHRRSAVFTPKSGEDDRNWRI